MIAPTAATQIGSRYGIPIETITSREFYFPVASAGSNVIGCVGSIDSAMTLDTGQMLVDSEIVGLVLRALQGVTVNSETLALEVINRVQPGKHFLSEKHTRDHYAQEHYLSKSLDSVEILENRKGTEKSAKGKVREILERHAPHRLDQSVIKNLQSIVHNAMLP